MQGKPPPSRSLTCANARHARSEGCRMPSLGASEPGSLFTAVTFVTPLRAFLLNTGSRRAKRHPASAGLLPRCDGFNPKGTLQRVQAPSSWRASSAPRHARTPFSSAELNGRPLRTELLRKRRRPVRGRAAAAGSLRALATMLLLVVEQAVQRVEVGLRGRDDDVVVRAAARVHAAVGRGHADGHLAQRVDAARDGLHR